MTNGISHGYQLDKSISILRVVGMRGSRNFRKGGPGQSDKKGLTTLFFFSPQLIIYHFSWFQRGSNFFQGGGGGSNCLFPIETNITCDFPGGVRTPVPPSGSALGRMVFYIFNQILKETSVSKQWRT